LPWKQGRLQDFLVQIEQDSLGGEKEVPDLRQ